LALLTVQAAKELELDSFASALGRVDSRRPQVLQLGIMLHSLVIGFTLALALTECRLPIPHNCNIIPLALQRPLAQRMHSSIAALPSAPPPTDAGARSWSFTWFCPVLALLFALTTPTGIFSGLIVFSNRNHHPSTGTNANGMGVKVAEGVLVLSARAG
jgi:hypothetical protein